MLPEFAPEDSSTDWNDACRTKGLDEARTQFRRAQRMAELMAMMAIKGIYAPYEIRRLNHGIGYATAAIELVLPTYGAQLGLQGRIATYFVLNPHPTLIPAIEAGFVDSVYCFGSEIGMEPVRSTI